MQGYTHPPLRKQMPPHWSGQMMDWSGEISGTDSDMMQPRPMDQMRPEQELPGGMQMPSMQQSMQMNGENQTISGREDGSGGMRQRPSGNLSMDNMLPDEVIEMPTSVSQAYIGSLKRFLNQNKGNYIAANFLFGTQNMESVEGILYEVGNDYLVIYQQHRERYIVCDLYSLKTVEFYDLQRFCERWQERGM